MQQEMYPTTHLQPKPLTWFKKWLNQCLSSHGYIPSSATALPTRLIDVESASKEPHFHITIIHEKGTCLALTHYWGQIQPLTTTLSTLELRIDEIPFSDFPKTFQDAINPARHLDIQYICITSLCVFQDFWKTGGTKPAECATYANTPC